MLHALRTTLRFGLPLVALVLLPGCNTTGNPFVPNPGGSSAFPVMAPPAKQTATIDPARLSTAQREMRERNERLRETVMEGVLIGAAAGAAIGAIATRSADGAIIGGLIGSGVGYVAGSVLAETQGEAGERLDTIEGLTKAMKEKNEKTETAIAGIQTVIDEDKKKLALLNRQLKAKAIDKAKYEQELAIIQADQNDIRQTRESLKKQVETYETSLADQRKKNASSVTKDAEKSLADLKKNSERMRVMSEVADRLMPTPRV
ncbi:glycine zipper domain-containing protein [Azospirillum rugosum]|uniref:Gas vesicle protein n=1 Tax=Azospirillum rugosum TaxID=416170 RepID=A0ABS4SRS0_9PROT|nr:glycine zipper domain-containing protein [Azospirillum rugosum]MBP2295254.1 gas vesicle protein [Azospirillum rugosum]MDQ0528628.1 gas vesicle protein [Azospirillum rugosum]